MKMLKPNKKILDMGVCYTNHINHNYNLFGTDRKNYIPIDKIEFKIKFTETGKIICKDLKNTSSLELNSNGQIVEKREFESKIRFENIGQDLLILHTKGRNSSTIRLTCNNNNLHISEETINVDSIGAITLIELNETVEINFDTVFYAALYFTNTKNVPIFIISDEKIGNNYYCKDCIYNSYYGYKSVYDISCNKNKYQEKPIIEDAKFMTAEDKIRMIATNNLEYKNFLIDHESLLK